MRWRLALQCSRVSAMTYDLLGCALAYRFEVRANGMFPSRARTPSHYSNRRGASRRSPVPAASGQSARSSGHSAISNVMNNMNEWAAVVGRSMRPVPEHLPTRIRSVTFSAGSEAIIDRYGLKNQKISPWISRHGDAAFVLKDRKSVV